MQIATLIGLVLLAVIALLVLGFIGLLVYLSCTLFRHAADVEIKNDYLPPELSGGQAQLENAELTYAILEDLGSTEFVLPDAARAVEEAKI